MNTDKLIEEVTDTIERIACGDDDRETLKKMTQGAYRLIAQLRERREEIDRLEKDVKTWHDCAEKTTDLWVAAKEKKASIEQRIKEAIWESVEEYLLSKPGE